MNWWSLIPRAVRQWIALRAIRRWLAALLPAPLVEGIMRGWKTWAGGVALIAGGLALIATEVSAGTFEWPKISEGLAMIGAGFAAIGIGHKIERGPTPQ